MANGSGYQVPATGVNESTTIRVVVVVALSKIWITGVAEALDTKMPSMLQGWGLTLPVAVKFLYPPTLRLVTLIAAARPVLEALRPTLRVAVASSEDRRIH